MAAERRAEQEAQIDSNVRAMRVAADVDRAVKAWVRADPDLTREEILVALVRVAGTVAGWQRMPRRPAEPREAE